MIALKQKIKSILEVNTKPNVVVLTGAGISAESGIKLSEIQMVFGKIIKLKK